MDRFVFFCGLLQAIGVAIEVVELWSLESLDLKYKVIKLL